jgi:hypothetical protein
VKESNHISVHSLRGLPVLSFPKYGPFSICDLYQQLRQFPVRPFLPLMAFASLVLEGE